MHLILALVVLALLVVALVMLVRARPAAATKRPTTTPAQLFDAVDWDWPR